MGGLFGGMIGFLAGVWFVQHLRKIEYPGSPADGIIKKGAKEGMFLGIFCSSAMHILLMTAYRNLNLWPILIGAVFGLIFGAGVGAVITAIFRYSKKPGHSQSSEARTQKADL